MLLLLAVDSYTSVLNVRQNIDIVLLSFHCNLNRLFLPVHRIQRGYEQLWPKPVTCVRNDVSWREFFRGKDEKSIGSSPAFLFWDSTKRWKAFQDGWLEKDSNPLHVPSAYPKSAILTTRLGRLEQK